jgi:outer membrane protein OmpA-like peptidoglycan-associated protein
MKNCTYFISFLMSVCLSFVASAQDAAELAPGYYVVVGAYAPAHENIARNYAAVLGRKGFNASYGFNSSRNYFFVYLRYFTDLKESLRDMQKTRKQPEFAGAWVRVVPGDIAAVKAQEPVVKAAPAGEQNTEAQEQLNPTEIAAQSPAPVTYVSLQADEIEVTDNPEIKQYDRMTLGNTEVFLSLFNAANNRIVEGVVKVTDADRTRLIREVRGNEYLLLPDPKNKSGQLTLVCEAFGYRKIQQQLNYALPLADTVKDYVDLMGTTLVVKFDLVRYRRGDVATLSNVSFYYDAALMLPESKPELDGLLQLMQENPKYRIRLHGHANGNYQGRIITLGENKSFFSLEGSRQGFGSSKNLSYSRADVIREFLQTNGIDPARMEVKAWGGKKPIYDKLSVNAKKNVRVELEFLSE